MDYKSLTDEELILQHLKKNDDAALEALIKRYLPRVYSLARQYTGDADNAADIAQEAFVKAWKNLKRFDASRRFQAWMFTITKNTALDWLKRKTPAPFSSFENAEREESFVETLADSSPPLAETLNLKEMSQSIDLAAENLPPAYRTVILLRHKEDLTFREIAERLNTPLNTVKSQYRRALILLREMLERNIEE